MTGSDPFEVLDNSSKYSGLLKQYKIGHSLLLIELISSSKSFYLTFDNVQYISSPVHWQGANITIGSTEARDELITIAELDDIWKGMLKLYLLGSKQQVKILAQNILKTEDIPPNFT